ncbi:MAG: type II methionyl aminopeptidase [Candidatus Woesearchaeota archaeon]|jgi:methionyl aminopeptidase
MDQEIIDKYLKAGKIAAECLQYGSSLIKEGVKVREVLEKVEEKIVSLGGKPAFPAQISLNEFAAHSCSDLNDVTILKDQVVKLDIGVHIDGYIADTALTVDLSGKYTHLVKASREALNNALKIAVPGTTLGEIGKTIQDTIISHGFSPVKNLSGHGLGKFEIHTSPSIPNYDNGNKNVLKEGQVIAIEPFASTGSGLVQESSPATVFTLVSDSGVRDPISRNILKEIKTYQGLPFAKRWLEQKFTSPKTNFGIKQLTTAECLQHHPPLFDTNRGMISQAEHSVIVMKEPIVFTRI